MAEPPTINVSTASFQSDKALCDSVTNRITLAEVQTMNWKASRERRMYLVGIFCSLVPYGNMII